MTGSGRPRGPGAVVRSAYLAANRGRYAEANKAAMPEWVERLRRTSASLRKSAMLLSRAMRRSSNPKKAAILKIAADSWELADPNLCWKTTTRSRSIKSVRVLQERVRGRHAEVRVALRLTDGRLVDEKESLVWNGRQWLIGEPRRRRTRVSGLLRQGAK
jgi:hypothetical protein